MRLKQTYRIFLLIFVTVIGFGCKSADTEFVSDQEDVAYENLLTLLENKAYLINIKSIEPFNTLASTQVINSIMIPQTGNSAARINVNGDGHVFKMNKNTVEGSMPFFGEMRMGSGHYGNSDGGINIKSEPKDLKLLPNDKKKKVTVKFQVQDLNSASENYNVTLTAFPNGKADIVFVSTHRTLIRYNGMLKPIDDID